MRFEYIALIGAAVFLSNAIGELAQGVSSLTIGDIFVALAIICAYIDAFIKQLQPYKKYLGKLAVVLAFLGLFFYGKHFM